MDESYDMWYDLYLNKTILRKRTLTIAQMQPVLSTGQCLIMEIHN